MLPNVGHCHQVSVKCGNQRCMPGVVDMVTDHNVDVAGAAAHTSEDRGVFHIRLNVCMCDSMRT